MIDFILGVLFYHFLIGLLYFSIPCYSELVNVHYKGSPKWVLYPLTYFSMFLLSFTWLIGFRGLKK